MEQFIQIKIENSEDFKNEIIRGVVSQIKDLGFINKTTLESEDDLVPRIKTSEILNISLVKLWQISKDNLLPVIKIGGKVLYKRKDIQEFINSQNKF
jgi:hypothetical protein